VRCARLTLNFGRDAIDDRISTLFQGCDIVSGCIGMI